MGYRHHDSWPLNSSVCILRGKKSTFLDNKWPLSCLIKLTNKKVTLISYHLLPYTNLLTCFALKISTSFFFFWRKCNETLCTYLQSYASDFMLVNRDVYNFYGFSVFHTLTINLNNFLLLNIYVVWKVFLMAACVWKPTVPPKPITPTVRSVVLLCKIPACCLPGWILWKSNLLTCKSEKHEYQRKAVFITHGFLRFLIWQSFLGIYTRRMW